MKFDDDTQSHYAQRRIEQPVFDEPFERASLAPLTWTILVVIIGVICEVINFIYG